MPTKIDDQAAAKFLAAAESGLLATTEAAEQRLRQAVPTDEGDLEGDVTSDIVTAGQVGLVGFGSPSSFYWRFPNDGTVHQPAQHFVESAVEGTRPMMTQLFRQAFRKKFG